VSAGQKREESGVSTSSMSTSEPSAPCANSNLVSAMMMPRCRACSAANSYNAIAVSRTRAASSAPTSFTACSKLMVSSCSPMAALVEGVNRVCGSLAACFNPAGSLMPEMAPVFW
jgi:hypothetical protein